jgi:ApbE superfamily uncharacterized protein (UPF0280 family)
MSASVARLPDGRLHLQHGPIDLILIADGPARAEAEVRAVARFAGLLEGLVEELPALRSPDALPVRGPVARLMTAAVAPFRPAFITPMAAVAGAVADTVLAAMAGPGLTRASVNNGGDIALYLTPGTAFDIAIAARPGWPDRISIRATDPVRGIATSGWRGRSQSLGIAEAVTVLARTAALADAAATMVANAVDLPGHPAIHRRPAIEIKAESDLGHRLVTTDVGPLTPAEVALALDRGQAAADAFRARGLIEGAALFLQSEARLVGALPGLETALEH